ncbi:MAG: ribonuclease III [Bacteroidia bacterium]
MSLFLPIFRSVFSKDNDFIQSVKNITGFTPRNLALYHLAFRHRAQAEEIKNGAKKSNERLEYLGDAILGAIVADFLFKKFPYKEEGFLTEMRSRIVSRDHLNKLAYKIGLNEFILTTPENVIKNKSIFGDAFEALIGAIYLDKGYLAAREFITNRIIKNHVDIDELETSEFNYKSKLIEWAQKEKKSITFELSGEEPTGTGRLLKIKVMVDREEMGQGMDFSKKKAEQIAAEVACKALNI